MYMTSMTREDMKNRIIRYMKISAMEKFTIPVIRESTFITHVDHGAYILSVNSGNCMEVIRRTAENSIIITEAINNCKVVFVLMQVKSYFLVTSFITVISFMNTAAKADMLSFPVTYNIPYNRKYQYSTT